MRNVQVLAQLLLCEDHDRTVWVRFSEDHPEQQEVIELNWMQGNQWDPQEFVGPHVLKSSQAIADRFRALHSVLRGANVLEKINHFIDLLMIEEVTPAATAFYGTELLSKVWINKHVKNNSEPI